MRRTRWSGARRRSSTAPTTSASLQVQVTDVAGNQKLSTVRTLQLDNTAPTVTLADPGANIAGTVTLTATATSDTAHVVFQQRATGAATWTDITTDTTSPYSAA